MSIILDKHRWRGISAAFDSIRRWSVVLGFVSISRTPGKILERFRKAREQLDRASRP